MKSFNSEPIYVEVHKALENLSQVLQKFTESVAIAFGVPARFFRKRGDWRTGNPNWTKWDSWRNE